VVDESRVRESRDRSRHGRRRTPLPATHVVRGDSKPADAGPSESKLDAEIVVGGRLGPCEAVVLRMRGRLAYHAESVVIPAAGARCARRRLVASGCPDKIAYDPLGVVRRSTDHRRAAEP